MWAWVHFLGDRTHAETAHGGESSRSVVLCALVDEKSGRARRTISETVHGKHASSQGRKTERGVLMYRAGTHTVELEAVIVEHSLETLIHLDLLVLLLQALWRPKWRQCGRRIVSKRRSFSRYACIQGLNHTTHT